MPMNELLAKIRLQATFSDLLGRAEEAPSGAEIVDECLAVARMLVDKNKLYGDSALNPIRIFSKASPIEQILVRMDDKINRLAKGSGVETEDIFGDLLGYIVLLKVAERRALKNPMAYDTTEEHRSYDPYLSPPQEEEEWEFPFAEPASPHVQGAAADIVATAEPEVSLVEMSVAAGVSWGNGHCQECKATIEADSALCDGCFQRRFKREKIDLSGVDGAARG